MSLKKNKNNKTTFDRNKIFRFERTSQHCQMQHLTLMNHWTAQLKSILFFKFILNVFIYLFFQINRTVAYEWNDNSWKRDFKRDETKYHHQG